MILLPLPSTANDTTDPHIKLVGGMVASGMKLTVIGGCVAERCGPRLAERYGNVSTRHRELWRHP